MARDFDENRFSDHRSVKLAKTFLLRMLGLSLSFSALVRLLRPVAKNQLVWSATIKTTEPENVQTSIKSYVAAVIKALDAQNLFPGRQ
jgi:hypothetical protein